ncbi:MAG: TonB-dependent receptor [Chitinophagia bacterium]|jgi:TonB-linked SusC/RagA family outer membrane protein|nr:TonB-dependent receptor [Chitinophagia bacterium]
MKSIRLLFTMIPMLCLSFMAQAQKIEITGKVTDQATGLPLVGASIIVTSNTGVSTKENGAFTLSVSKETKSFTVSFVGYIPQSVNITNAKAYTIALVPDVNNQNEVVVIGYGTQKKSSLTGAIAKFKNENLDEAPVSRVDQALQGKIAGLTIQNTSSEAGAAPKISIRGISSVNAGASPLIVIDGMPVPDGLSFLNPADIESIEVLKDAASAAIYGSRGASGVIMVTTKKGAVGKTKYNFKYSAGQKKDYKRYDIMTTKEYVSMLFTEMQLRSTDPSVVQSTNTVADGDRASYIIETALRNSQSTDWQSESLRPGGFKNIMLSATGGSKEMRYFVSGGYQNDEGMQNKSNYEKFNIRSKVDIDLSKKVKLTFNLNPSYAKKISPSQNFTNFWRAPTWLPVYHTAQTAALVNTNPQYAGILPGDYAHPRHFSGLKYTGNMPDGTVWTSATTANPSGSAQQNPRSDIDRSDLASNEYRLQSSAELSIELAKGLIFKTLGTSLINYTNGLNFYEREYNSEGSTNIGVFTNNKYTDLLSENTLNYTKSANKNELNILAGFTSQTTKIQNQQTTGNDFPSDDIRTLNSAAQIDKTGTTGTNNQIGLVSYLGRINYAYDNKYLFSASYRADGSSYFAQGKKWGKFPSISAGWVISKEKFLSDVAWLSNLKLRSSYGVSGNNRIVDFAFLDLLYGANYTYGSGTGTTTPGLVSSSAYLSNPNITWESTNQNNYGIDLALFRNRVNLTIDMYKSKTDRLLLQQSAMAFTGVPQFWNNLGSLQNKGFEIELSTKNIQKKNFTWTTSANISHNENKILQLGTEAFLLNQGERTEVYRNKVGDPLVVFYGFKTDGVWISQDQINSSGLTSTLTGMFVPGGLKVVDMNGDGKIDNSDRTDLGNPYPDFNWGITNNFKFKGFDFSFLIQGVQGGKLINGDPNYNESRRTIRTYNQNRWISAAHPGDGKTPYSTNGFNWMLTDYVIEDASYFALREVNFGYTLPSSTIKRLKINSMRFYLSAQNLYFHMADGYRGLNPEGRFNSGPYSSVLIDGYQRGSFPIPQTITAGIDINF